MFLKLVCAFFYYLLFFMYSKIKNEKAGFGQLLNPLKLFDSHFHSMQVHVIPVCVNSVKKIKGELKMWFNTPLMGSRSRRGGGDRKNKLKLKADVLVSMWNQFLLIYPFIATVHMDIKHLFIFSLVALYSFKKSFLTTVQRT